MCHNWDKLVVGSFSVVRVYGYGKNFSVDLLLLMYLCVVNFIKKVNASQIDKIRFIFVYTQVFVHTGNLTLSCCKHVAFIRFGKLSKTHRVMFPAEGFILFRGTQEIPENNQK